MTRSPDVAPLYSSAFLRVRGLTVQYSGEGRSAALQQVDFDMAPGEVVGVLGESGSGKSTLALSLLGLLPADASVAGSISFENENLLEISESRWTTIRGAKIAMIFQEPGLCLSPVMRVGDQIAEVLRAHRSGGRKARKLECEALLRDVRFAEPERIYRAYPHQLSGGELHRVAIAQALACQPRLVIADEATRSLDVTVQAEVLNVLRETCQRVGSALIFITHNPALLAGFADRVLTMYGGRIVEDGPLPRVFRQPLHPYTKGLLQLVLKDWQGGALGSRSLPAIPGSLTDQDRAAAGCVFEPRCYARTAVCRNESPLEVAPELNRRVRCFHHGS